MQNFANKTLRTISKVWHSNDKEHKDQERMQKPRIISKNNHIPKIENVSENQEQHQRAITSQR